ncbi:unnamed protein product [Toxocara canis]|uniref:ShKT domain-containing protein n=1 Tax=Toxocara canis TaxID=6265 RepID=A0A183TV06_TOXCA|nr:unnamed protein product [Toxocara canis]
MRSGRTCGMCDAGEQEEYFEQIGGGEEEEEESYTEPTPEEETTDATDEYPDAEEIDSKAETPEVSPHSVRKSGSCIDLAQDCAEKINLCSNVQYNGVMARMCQRTCGLCDSAGRRS